MNKYFKYLRPEVASLLPTQYTKTLEIGCGEGLFTQNLKQSGENWGIEPNQDAANTASKNMHKVLIGTYEQTQNQLPDCYFDLIICNDVIEHMADHDHFLENIKLKLSKQGCLVASIPNIRYGPHLFEMLFQKEWRYKDAGILDRTHLRFFTEHSIKRTFKEHGYSLDSLIGLNNIVTKRSSFKKFMRALFILTVIGISFGYFSDIRFLQFGIRARLNPLEPE